MVRYRDPYDEEEYDDDEDDIDAILFHVCVILFAIAMICSYWR